MIADLGDGDDQGMGLFRGGRPGALKAWSMPDAYLGKCRYSYI